MIVLVHVSQI